MDWMNESDNDYFEPESVPEEKPHVETAEEREERELRETTIERAHNRRRLFFMCLAGVLLLVIVGAVWVRYYHPYLESNERGVITSVANKGMAFKTFEAEMISEKHITDTVRIYQSDFKFTIKSDSLARLAIMYAGTGKRVTVSYEKYKGVLPWRGESPCVATGIALDSVMP